jgi:hypothetical protein
MKHDFRRYIMNMGKSKQTEMLLQQLFSGNVELRERALLAVSAHERDRVREVVKVREDAAPLIQMMLADLAVSSGELRKNYASQYNRRNAIRALAAAVDGTIFSLKRLALTSAPLTGAQLDAEEMDFLREQQISPQGGKVRLPGFRENLKRTFKLFAKAYHISHSTDFGHKGFEALCLTFELRHRVIHPKSSSTFHVQDDETKRAGDAIKWLSDEINQLLGDCQKSLDKTPT